MPVTLEPKHLAAWKLAADHTKAATDTERPTYGAWMPASRGRKRVEAEREVAPEPDTPKELEGLTVSG